MTKSAKKSKELVNKFAALGDQNRYRIMMILTNDDDICVSGVAAKIGISTAGTSQHMKILEQAGLIKKMRKGQKICYQVDTADPKNIKILRMVMD